jgi:hypothetical protein
MHRSLLSQAVEAAARLGMYKKKYLEKARLMFEQMLGYGNHLGLFSEEIGKRGEHLGNFPQAFTHLALISAAINLDKSLNYHRGGGNFLASQKEFEETQSASISEQSAAVGPQKAQPSTNVKDLGGMAGSTGSSSTHNGNPIQTATQ